MGCLTILVSQHEFLLFNPMKNQNGVRCTAMCRTPCPPPAPSRKRTPTMYCVCTQAWGSGCGVQGKGCRVWGVLRLRSSRFSVNFIPVNRLHPHWSPTFPSVNYNPRRAYRGPSLIRTPPPVGPSWPRHQRRPAHERRYNVLRLHTGVGFRV